ncbi:hypothetical protein EA462_06325 [Natrarchaeobius halalkaliphilus]|uniref:DUF7344 domain-containing protein n=1 Tax=Natrarchaeobius halalkaliphilus TaxID=1679091 RepID=A0A3N6LSQ1_9EURY|nr:hypothetical protein [Natrarchaeobius halalkaliphilus]RQG91567.1 hypothetical protein EA462_06325 [Natrarchaeobius halalkaliphilus]
MVDLTMNVNTQTVTTEVALELVTDQCRQQILHHLIENEDGAVDIDELVDRINSANVRTERPHRSPSHLKMTLYHAHLPKLAEAGVIDYDAQSDTVRYHATTRVEKLIAFITDELR